MPSPSHNGHTHRRVLITGGAGFVGSHLADELLAHGYQVRVLDNLSEQVHGASCRWPPYLSREVELMIGDVRDTGAVRRALNGVDAVFHLAAAVGVGQSMYEIARYTDINNLGTAVLLEALSRQRGARSANGDGASDGVRRLVVASSMSLYGEGLYRTQAGEVAAAAERSLEQLRRHDWEMRDAAGQPLVPAPTPETKPPALTSIYALSKYDQERMCLIAGRAYDLDVVALRFFNIYGPRQALSNPYTGVLAIFAARYLNGKRPLVFEDGQQQRDFVSVHDIACACRLALEVPRAAGQVLNIGSGQPRTVREIAARLAGVLGLEGLEPEITGKYRVGDIRHCFADIRLAQSVLGYQPQVCLEEGLAELAGWLGGQIAIDHVAEAGAELAARGLTL